MFFWFLQIDQKTNKNFVRISALASKKWSNQKKIRALYTTNWMILFRLSYVHYFFDLASFYFLEARAEILKKKFVGFLRDLKTPKGHFEIN